jgi:hypothetical protein
LGRCEGGRERERERERKRAALQGNAAVTFRASASLGCLKAWCVRVAMSGKTAALLLLPLDEDAVGRRGEGREPCRVAEKDGGGTAVNLQMWFLG